MQPHLRMASILVILMSILSACSSPTKLIPPSTPEILKIYYPPALQPLARIAESCPIDKTHLFPALFEFTQPQLIPPDADAVLWLGDPVGGLDGFFPYVIGEEKVKVIISAGEAIRELSIEDLRTIYTSEIDSWEDINGKSIPLQAWIYPDSDVTQLIFTQTILQGLHIRSDAQIAPNPQEMLDAIGKNSGAVGYVPGIWLSQGPVESISRVKTIELPPEFGNAMTLPILALTPEKPKENMTEFLICLQDQSNKLK